MFKLQVCLSMNDVKEPNKNSIFLLQCKNANKINAHKCKNQNIPSGYLLTQSQTMKTLEQVV